MAKIDTNCQPLNNVTGTPIPGVYGLGLGFPLAASDPDILMEFRRGANADWIELYMKHIANKILNKILPEKKPEFIMA